MARVVIMQPYVPAYRATFFAALARRLREQGHELMVAAATPTGVQARRNDVARIPGVRQLTLRVHTFKLGSSRLRLTKGRLAWKHADVIVTELAAGASVTDGALLQQRRPVGVWGHVEAFTAPDTRTARALRRWQARRASHVLAYTDTGAAVAEAWGVAPPKITSLRNSVDTTALSVHIERVRAEGSAGARRRLGAGDGPVFAMIGGLDESKRIDLVVETLDVLWETRRDIQLIVGGRGELEPAFARAVTRGQARVIGYVGDAAKADIANVAAALLNPGRVGLIAVESMTMGLPIITTTGTRHGPEFEYLTPGMDSIVCTADAATLASTMAEMADDPALVDRLGSAIRRKAPLFSLDHMVSQYAVALDCLIEDAETRSRHSKM